MIANSTKLGDLLLEKALLTDSQLTVAIQKQKNSKLKLGEVLVAEKLLSRKQLNNALKVQKALRRTILSTLISLTPLQLISALELPDKKHVHNAQLLAGSLSSLDHSFDVSISNAVKGFNYMLRPDKQADQSTLKRPAESGVKNFDVSVGKDRFSVSMQVSL